MSPSNRREVVSWVVYDLANTIFALGVVGLYFSDWMLSENQPDSALATAQIAAAVVVIFAAPWIGARSDVLGKRIPALVVTTVVAVAATFFLATGPVLLTFILLWVALVAVNTGGVVYDALLVDVSTEENRGWVSGLGVGIGYVGSFIGLGLGLLALDVLDWGFPGAFRLIAIAFFVFAIPTFVFVKERPGRADVDLPSIGDIVPGLIRSWRTASRYPGVVRFLTGRFLYTDAINTLIGGFLALFVIDELGLDRRFFTALMAVAITAAIVGGITAGRLTIRWGPIAVLRIVLIMWLIGIVSGIVAATSGITALIWAIGPIGGAALGATWASDRVVMTRVSPPRHLGEFYGLYATVGRFATVGGPLLWALVVDVLRLGRVTALGVLGLLVLAGWWVVGGVDDSIRSWPEEERLVTSEKTDPDQP